MCGCNDCNGITLFSGTDGRGIVSITDNQNGTFTILFSDGTTWTSGDLTGPQGPVGPQGPPGEDGANVIFSFIGPFVNIETPNIVAPIDSTWFTDNGDTLLLTYKFSTSVGDILKLNTNRGTGSPIIDTYNLFTNSVPSLEFVRGTLDIVLIKSNNSFVGHVRVIASDASGNPIIQTNNLTLTDFLIDPISIELYGSSAPGDLSIENVVIQRVKII